MESKNNEMTLLVQNLTKEDEFHSLDVEMDITVEGLKCLLEIESSIPVDQQAIFYKNKELNQDTKKLVDCGISNNDMLTLTKTSALIGGGGQGLNQNDQNLLSGFFNQLNKDVATARPKQSFNQMFSGIFHNQQNQAIKRQVEQLKQIWQNDPHQRTFLKANNPELGAALEANDQRAIEKIVGEKLKAQMDAQRKEQERMAKLMNADPNDPEAQKQIEEEIRKGLVAKNYATA